MEKRYIPYNSKNGGWLIDFAFMYCLGKNWLFNMFFGWRRTDLNGCEFILSKKAWKDIEDYIKAYK